MPSGFYVPTKVDKEFRNELQNRNINLSFTNDQLTKILKNHLKNVGVKDPVVCPPLLQDPRQNKIGASLYGFKMRHSYCKGRCSSKRI